MRKPVALVLIMAVILVFAWITKPSDQQCIDEAKSQFKQHNLSSATTALPNNINHSVFDATLEKAFVESLAVQDKILYKEIHQAKGNNNLTIGWGAFGIVHVQAEP